MRHSKIRWITIDAGGTLLFPHPSVGEIYAEVLTRYGYTRSPEVLEEAFFRVWKEDVKTCMPAVTAESEKERWRGVVNRTFAELSGRVDLDVLFDDLWDTFCQAERWRVPEKTEETLVQLRSRGYRLAILSNWDERLRPLLKGMELERHFEEIFVSCEVGFEKPDPQLFSMVETCLGATGAEILHIGDSHHHDVLGARSCGWHTVHAFSGRPSEADCARIECFSELLGWLPGPAGEG